MDNFSAQQALQTELLPGETLLWSGQPSRRVIFHKEDLAQIPFSLFWGGFAIFWMFGAMTGFGSKNPGSWFFGLFWGSPFVLIGQYMIWGRFVYSWWKKGRVFYGVTPRRVIILDRAWGSKTNIAYVDQLPTIERAVRSDGIGTLRFGFPLPAAKKRRSLGLFDNLNTGGVPCFVDVENAEAVYSLVAQAKERLAASRNLT